ncbi:glycosyltransferase family 4 protein [Georgenia sp. MJ173]|uniref:glycosyltransferase family 4 protein n=1 Tax=Georgenia sunbinii TaxID=3117728 RepID=UPI002F26B45E
MSRITYIHQHFKRPDEAGGTRSWEFARRLASDGHRVTVICAGAQSRRYETEGFRVRQLRVAYANRFGFLARIMSFIRFMCAATLVTLRVPADLIYATSTPLTVAIPALARRLLMGTPYIFEVRDLWPAVPVSLGYLRNPKVIRVAQCIERLAYRHAAEIVALSPSMADGVVAVNLAVRVSVIPNSADQALFHSVAQDRNALRGELNWPNEKRIALYAGSLGHSYDTPWLVDLAQHLRQTECIIVIAGSGAAEDSLRLAVQKRGLDDTILLAGAVSKQDVAKMYSAADLILSTLLPHPSLEGNSLNKVFDALAAGKAVAFNHGGWLTNRLTEAGAGWRLSRESGSAAESLRRILDDERSLRQAEAAATVLGETEFARDTHYSSLRQVITRALGTLDTASFDEGKVA